MSRATFRFYAELNDFLPQQRRNTAFVAPFAQRASIKDAIEALGVPHPEVAAILVNAAPAGWEYLVQQHDSIAVYPVSAAPELLVEHKVGPPPLNPARFVLDVHLGKLAAYLRLLGFDSVYRSAADDAELAQTSAAQQRILLTRDRNLLKRSLVVYGYFVRATDPRQQVVELVRRYDLFGSLAPLQRCSRCNGLLVAVDKAGIASRLPPQTRSAYDTFQICSVCGQIYSHGSHVARLRQFIAEVRRNADPGSSAPHEP